jgi:hypothetical protein
MRYDYETLEFASSITIYPIAALSLSAIPTLFRAVACVERVWELRLAIQQRTNIILRANQGFLLGREYLDHATFLSRPKHAGVILSLQL